MARDHQGKRTAAGGQRSTRRQDLHPTFRTTATPAQLAAAWTTSTVTRYGRTDTVHLTDRTCLWYGPYRSRAVRVILVRDPGRTPTTGYQLALISTDLTSPAEAIVERYTARWSVESPSRTPSRPPASARPATASPPPSNAPSRSG